MHEISILSPLMLLFYLIYVSGQIKAELVSLKKQLAESEAALAQVNDEIMRGEVI